jgi:hypothetical protein
MKRLKSFFLAVSAVFLLSGCLYTNVLAPYDTDLNKTELGDKTGTASSQSLLWLVAWGDGSTAAAAKQGRISTITHMDREVFSVLFGLYTKTTTIVYGN